MQQMAALGADWWNDSCDLRELAEAVKNGAVGATSNPLIVSTALATDRERWMPVLDGLIRDHPTEIEDDIAWRLIAQIGREAAAILQPVYERTGGKKGFLSMQVSPKFYPNRDRMVEQGATLAALAPNIAIKVPATEAGMVAIEAMTARGIATNATVSFTVAQAVAAAEAVERGLKSAPNQTRLQPYVTLMVGRLDDYMKALQKRDNIAIDPAHLEWAGIAVFRRAARLFRERGYRATLLAAAYRHEGHWAEIVGPRVLQTIPYKWWKQFDLSAREMRVAVDDPIDPKAVFELSSKIPDFQAAYAEDGLASAQFTHYGATIVTLNQFLGGYQQLIEVVRARMLT